MHVGSGSKHSCMVKKKFLEGQDWTGSTMWFVLSPLLSGGKIPGENPGENPPREAVDGT